MSCSWCKGRDLPLHDCKNFEEFDNRDSTMTITVHAPNPQDAVDEILRDVRRRLPRLATAAKARQRRHLAHTWGGRGVS